MQIHKLKDLLLGASQSLSENKEKLNSLNVFPIPDGDTGTNMEKTMLGAIRSLRSIGDRELVPDDLNRLYDGVLMSSQGNSGVILSQWFKGFFGSLRQTGELTAATLDQAFLEATQSAYNAVVTPVEGTFLTVAREAHEFAEDFLDENTTVEGYLENALTGARESLNRTPELLPVLKEAGVVDSGGLGFVCIISGMISALNGNAPISADEIFDGMQSAVVETDDIDEFGYCTELILKLNDDSRADFKLKETIDHLNEIGNSVVAVQDGSKVKLHVHTLVPESVLEHCHRFGEFITIKIENMTIQHQQTLARSKEHCAVIAIANGSGITELFKNLGAKYIIKGGQSDNVSTEEIITCINRISADHIILLPNNKNILMVAEQVKSMLKDTDLHIVPSTSIAEGYSALSMMDLTADIDSILADMNGAIKNAVTGIIAKATRSVTYNNVEVVAGHYIGIVDDAVVFDCPDIKESIRLLLGSIKDIENKESVIAFCADSQLYSIADEMKAEMGKICPCAEVFLVNGGQEIYDYVFAVE